MVVNITITGWLFYKETVEDVGRVAIHEDELFANWRMLSNGDGYFKIDPLR